MSTAIQIEVQYDLFEATDDISMLRKELMATREELAKTRKGLFARHGELSKLYMELKIKQDAMENQLIMVARNK